MPKAKIIPQLDVTETSADKWVWEIDDPLFSGVGGDIAQLFKAQDFRPPGVLAHAPPSDAASLFAREAIQNSWDAASEWRKSNETNGRKIPAFSINFKFEELTGMARRQRIYALGLDEHSRVLANLTARGSDAANVGLADEELMTDIVGNDVPLRLLTLTEHAGLGMPGNFDNGKSRMMKALLRVGVANEAEGAGGAFGFGKAGLIAASRVRVVVAYSAFTPDSSDPDISRRLMGVTYWKGYQTNEQQYNGWARFGQAVEIPLGAKTLVTARPLENDEADQAAIGLGLQMRDPKKPDGTGTTFLLVDPAITAADLRRAIERYWWPAMLNQDDGLQITITDYDGTDSSPTPPVNDPHLRPFIRAFTIATQTNWSSDNKEEARYDLQPFETNRPRTTYKLGALGLVADPSGWSYPDDNEFEHRSIIALIRGPRMVVDYKTFPRVGLPHVRGVFVADNQVNELLRATEDPAHTQWSKTVVIMGKNALAPTIAGKVLSGIKEHLDEFRKGFAAPPRRPDDRTLPTLDELSKLMRGKKLRPPVGAMRQIRIALVEQAHTRKTSSNELECVASVSIKVADWVWSELNPSKEVPQIETVRVGVELSLAFVEDGETGDRLELYVECSRKDFNLTQLPNGKTLCEGSVKRDESVVFSVVSAAYSPDWTVRFTPTASITAPRVSPKKKSEIQ